MASVRELLGAFDVDCAAVCYDVGNDCVWMTARAKRAFEFKCNIVDMRFDHKTYHEIPPRFLNVSYGFDKTGTSIVYKQTLRDVLLLLCLDSMRCYSPRRS